jgi:hypothetical protein
MTGGLRSIVRDQIEALLLVDRERDWSNNIQVQLCGQHGR